VVKAGSKDGLLNLRKQTSDQDPVLSPLPKLIIPCSQYIKESDTIGQELDLTQHVVIM